jgi:hypothetical protein
MRVHVDKPWRDDQAPRIDHAVCGRLGGQRTNGLDPVSADRDIAFKPRISGTVDNLAPSDQNIERLGPLFLTE